MNLFVIPFPNIDPVVFSVGDFAIRWYSLAYIFGIILSYMISLNIVRLQARRTQGVYEIQQDHLESFVFSYAIVGVILGGRLGYVLFYNLPYFIEHPEDIFAVWQGGMSFHGGMLGVILAMLFFAYKHNINGFRLSDIVCCGLPFGLFLGRIANFINGELYGRVTDVPWGVIFPHAGPQPRHPSQLYEGVLEGFVLLIIIQILVRKTHILNKKGFISGFFLIGYGVSRFFVEIFREPDAHLGFIFANITMGMILSLPMIIIGIGIVIYSLTHKPHTS